MFTGIIETVGTIVQIKPTLVEVDASGIEGRLEIGESVAVNGICLTVSGLRGQIFSANLSPETYQNTNLKILRTASLVNFERALRLGDRVGGHFVTGHVDCMAILFERVTYLHTLRLGFKVKEDFSCYLIEKGSIAIDGVSLTIAKVVNSNFWVNIIPYTQKKTTLGRLQNGYYVNIEFDIFAKYIKTLAK